MSNIEEVILVNVIGKFSFSRAMPTESDTPERKSLLHPGVNKGDNMTSQMGFPRLNASSM